MIKQKVLFDCMNRNQKRGRNDRGLSTGDKDK